jgi:hypothetical protein
VESIVRNIAAQNGLQLKESKALSGGDINHVFLLNCISEIYVVKINHATKFPAMFEAEAKGLQLLAATRSFKIPNVIAFGALDSWSYLILEYIPQGSASSHFWNDFAENLAALHQASRPQFGLDHHNYIGSLPQRNKPATSASEFYISQRLEPQFKLATKKGFSFTHLAHFFKSVSIIIPDEVPALVHGDLWNGNYLVSEKGDPVLIDPAVAFASREIDLAMMQLFGGFPSEVFSTYNEIFPCMENWKDRISLWQLYYLLVHLNLFGAGYFSQVRNILKKYS